MGTEKEAISSVSAGSCLPPLGGCVILHPQDCLEGDCLGWGVSGSQRTGG